MDVTPVYNQVIRDPVLAIDTISHLHRFLAKNVNPTYAPPHSPLYSRPCTAYTCHSALAYLSNAEFVGSKYRIKVVTQKDASIPHFQYSHSTEEGSILIISEAAKIALENYEKELEGIALEQKRVAMAAKHPATPARSSMFNWSL
jgi:hypothetical protein